MRKLAILMLFFLANILNAEELNIDKDSIVEGACPFECCIYREWSVRKETILYKEKNVNSEKVNFISAGQSISALTGDVHIRPLKLIVEKDYGTHKKGEIIWLLDYLGEGLYRAWKEGEFTHINLPFSPYQEMKCRNINQCWARIEGEYKMDWWVKFKTENGVIGWSNQTGNFANNDSCG